MARFARVLCFLGMAALLPGATKAAPEQDAAPLVLSGDYDFVTFAQKDGRPVCTEHWRFNADGTQTVFSGQEIVTNTFRVGPYAGPGNYLLTTKQLTTNSLPDCMGSVAAGPRAHAVRTVIYINVQHDLVLCWGPKDDSEMPPPDKDHVLVFDPYARLIRSPRPEVH